MGFRGKKSEDVHRSPEWSQHKQAFDVAAA
jgi:hypothetical protein